MPRITPKPPEVIEAQIAAYASETMSNRADAAQVMSNIGQIAIDNPAVVTRSLGRWEIITEVEDLDEQNGNVGSGEAQANKVATERYLHRVDPQVSDKRLIGTRDQYIGYLRQVGGQSHDQIRVRAEVLKNYKDFAPDITLLRAEIASLPDDERHPNFLGKGLTSDVYLIDHGGAQYAVRIPVSKGVNPRAIEGYLQGAVAGRDVPHLEKIVAASYADGVTIAEIMPGKEVGKLTSTEVAKITSDQIEELIGTLIVANNKGVIFDTKPANFFYDPKEGFGIIDYSTSAVASMKNMKQDLGTLLGVMAGVINVMGLSGTDYGFKKTPQDYAKVLEIKKASLNALRLYRAAVEGALGPGAEGSAALQRIDKQIDGSQSTVNNYSNPEWVKAQIKELQEYKESLRPGTYTQENDWL